MLIVVKRNVKNGKVSVLDTDDMTVQNADFELLLRECATLNVKVAGMYMQHGLLMSEATCANYNVDRLFDIAGSIPSNIITYQGLRIYGRLTDRYTDDLGFIVSFNVDAYYGNKVDKFSLLSWLVDLYQTKQYGNVICSGGNEYWTKDRIIDVIDNIYIYEYASDIIFTDGDMVIFMSKLKLQQILDSRAKYVKTVMLNTDNDVYINPKDCTIELNSAGLDIVMHGNKVYRIGQDAQFNNLTIKGNKPKIIFNKKVYVVKVDKLYCEDLQLLQKILAKVIVDYNITCPLIGLSYLKYNIYDVTILKTNDITEQYNQFKKLFLDGKTFLASNINIIPENKYRLLVSLNKQLNALGFQNLISLSNYFYTPDRDIISDCEEYIKNIKDILESLKIHKGLFLRIFMDRIYSLIHMYSTQEMYINKEYYEENLATFCKSIIQFLYKYYQMSLLLSEAHISSTSIYNLGTGYAFKITDLQRDYIKFPVSYKLTSIKDCKSFISIIEKLDSVYAHDTKFRCLISVDTNSIHFMALDAYKSKLSELGLEFEYRSKWY